MKYLIFSLVTMLLIGCKKPTKEELEKYKEEQQNKTKPLITHYFNQLNFESYEWEHDTIRTKEPKAPAQVVYQYNYSNEGYIVKKECRQYRCGYVNTLTTLDITTGKKDCDHCGKPLELPSEEKYSEDKDLSPMLTFKWKKEKEEDEYETILEITAVYVKDILIYDHAARIDISSKFDPEALIKGTNRKRHELGIYRKRNSYVCTLVFEWKHENIIPGTPVEQLIKNWKEEKTKLPTDKKEDKKPTDDKKPDDKKPSEKDKPPEDKKQPENKPPENK